jgi:exosortase
MGPETIVTAAQGPKRGLQLALDEAWPLAAGFAALAVPTALSLADQIWSHEDGAQGPIILATGGWLLWRQLPEMRRDGVRGASWLTFALLALALPIYVAGRVLDFITLEAAGVYGAGLAMMQARYGARVLIKNWFPLLYLAFAIPPPSFVIDDLTAPLKRFAAFASTKSLALAGLPVSREGVTITIAQYELLVEDACSGMNSIMGLSAVSLLYIYLVRRASIGYALLLTSLVIPIAILANTIRIILLILITYFFGDRVGQSFLHYAAGLVLFATAVLLVFSLDRVLSLVLEKAGRKP